MGQGSLLRILFVHNRYLYRGGEDESRALEMRMLRERGEEVFEYEVDNGAIGQSKLVSIGLRSIWNLEQFNQIQKLIRRIQPAIMKVDNFSPIFSPSIFEAAKSLGVATLLSVRNYRLVCPSANLFRNGGVCTLCVGRKVALPAVRHRCTDSYLRSASIVASNAYAHWRGIWSDSIDGYVAVSESVKQQLIAGGFPAYKVSVKPNFIYDTGVGNGRGGHAVFVGRLTPEKGIPTLLSAWSRVGTVVPLKIIGEGPLQGLVEASAARGEGVEYLGRKTLDEVCDYLGRAKFLVFPAEWPEPFGRTIVEAYSKGTPVIGAETAPIRDMIEDGQTGLLYRPGDYESLAEKVLALAADPETLILMRENARSRYVRDYTESVNYTLMIEILQKLLSGSHRTISHLKHDLVT